MDGLFISLLTATVFFFILYCVVKSAVKNAILEAREHIEDERPKLTMVTCPTCGGEYEFDCPKCPHCKDQPE